MSEATENHTISNIGAGVAKAVTILTDLGKEFLQFISEQDKE